MTAWIVGAVGAFASVCLLCWALMRQQRGIADFLADENDWGAQ